MSEARSPPGRGASRATRSPVNQQEDNDTKSRWTALAEFDAVEADMANVQTRPVDTVRAEEEELLENSKPSRPSRDRPHQYPSLNRLATGGIAKPKLTPEELAERMEKMKLKNEQLVARRLRSEADENQYKEQEEARQLAQKEHLIKMKQKTEDNNRIQAAIDLQRDEVRQKKLGKALEWDQDKPTLDDDDALPASERFYVNYSRRGRGGNFEGRGRRGRGRSGNYRGREDLSSGNGNNQQLPPPIENDASWPALPSAISSQDIDQ